MKRPTDPPHPVCTHKSGHWEIEPHSGDVWCFACKPPRNLSDDLRRIKESLLDQEPQQ